MTTQSLVADRGTMRRRERRVAGGVALWAGLILVLVTAFASMALLSAGGTAADAPAMSEIAQFGG